MTEGELHPPAITLPGGAELRDRRENDPMAFVPRRGNSHIGQMAPRFNPRLAAAQNDECATIYTVIPINGDLPETLKDLLMFLRFIDARLQEAANAKIDGRSDDGTELRETEILLDLQSRAAWKAVRRRARSLSDIRHKLEIWEVAAADLDGAGGELGAALVNSVKQDLDALS